MQKAMSMVGKSRIDKGKDIIWIFNILASITGYKFLFGKKKANTKEKYLEIFFLPIPPSPSYCPIHPENLFLAFPAFVQTAAASLLQQLSYRFLDKTLRCHR